MTYGHGFVLLLANIVKTHDITDKQSNIVSLLH